jgi:hypothetical protein
MPTVQNSTTELQLIENLPSIGTISNTDLALIQTSVQSYKTTFQNIVANIPDNTTIEPNGSGKLKVNTSNLGDKVTIDTNLSGKLEVVDGSIVPTKLSTGGPNWDVDGNLTLNGNSSSIHFDPDEGAIELTPSNYSGKYFVNVLNDGSGIELQNQNSSGDVTAFFKMSDQGAISIGDTTYRGESAPLTIKVGDGNGIAKSNTRIGKDHLIIPDMPSNPFNNSNMGFGLVYYCDPSLTDTGGIFIGTKDENNDEYALLCWDQWNERIAFTVKATTGSIYTYGSGSATTWVNRSDYRLKKDYKPITNATKLINQLNPIKFTFSQQNEKSIGFIAHEIQEILPELVKGEKDGSDYQEINYIGIIPVLTKGLQEANKKIEYLEKENQKILERLEKLEILLCQK